MTAPFALVDSVSSIRTERIYNDVFITMTERVCRKPVEVDLASEFRYRKPIVGKNTLTIVISQSGETADTLAALREANRLGSRTLAVVNVLGSSIAREADYTVFIPECSPLIAPVLTAVVLQLFGYYVAAAKGLDIDKPRNLAKSVTVE